MAKKTTKKKSAGRAPKGYLRGDDGNLYPKRTVSGTVAIAVSGDVGKAARERNARVEKAMGDAILKANAEGITDPVKIRERIVAARNEALKTE